MLVKYKKVNILNVGDIRIIPGNNEIDQAQFEAAVKLYPKLRRLLESGDLETFNKAGKVRDGDDVVAAAAGEPGAAKVEAPLELADISKLNEKNAVKLVKDTVDSAVLTAWYETEKRAGVIKAIEAQFDAIAKAGEPEKKDA